MSAPPPDPRPSRLRRWLLRGLLGLLIATIAAELVCRFALGLGDPPLSVADADMEYRFAPSKEYRRFGHRVAYNSYSMRSDDWPAHKTRPNELRVLFLGDSVINGGSETDQSELATSILQVQLAKELNRPVLVGNVSAGSWGPPNQAAWVRRYGLLEADVVVLVLSSHDYADDMDFKTQIGVNPAYPDHAPLLALQEAIMRYLPRYLPGHAAAASGPTSMPAPEQIAIDHCMVAIDEIAATAKKGAVGMIVMQHLERGELETGEMQVGHQVILDECQKLGVQTIQLGPAMKAALDAGKPVYRDYIHPSAAGQKVMADVLLQPIKSAVGK